MTTAYGTCILYTVSGDCLVIALCRQFVEKVKSVESKNSCVFCF